MKIAVYTVNPANEVQGQDIQKLELSFVYKCWNLVTCEKEQNNR